MVSRGRVTTKPCVICDQMIPMDRDYSSNTCGSEGCKKEQTWQRNLWRNHKLRADDFYAMAEKQNWCCAVCSELLLFTIDGRKDNINIDHDHACCPTYRSCGECIRGILCNGCNGGMGLFKDNPANLVAAAEYLWRYQGEIER